MGKALDAIMWKVDTGGFTKEEKKSFSPNIAASTYPSKIIALAIAAVFIATAGILISNSELLPSLIRDITATGHNVFNASMTTSVAALTLRRLFQLFFVRENLTTSLNPLRKLNTPSLEKLAPIVKAI